MADSAHSTATTDVHPLTGCSAPGAASPDFIAVAEMRVPRLPVDEQHAAVIRLAKLHGLDAEVIELAERTEALALRECALWGRLADLDDAVTRAMPPKPVRPTMQTRMQHAEATVDGARTISVTEPPEWRVEHQANEAAHAAALVEHERLEAEIGARLGLPLANKLTSRASRRLSRWGRRLAGLAPRTYAGLRAKAAALRATVEDGQLYDTWRQVLAVSVSTDAVRLIEAEAEERFLEDQARDGKLFALLDRWHEIQNGRSATEAAYDAASDRAKAAYPPMPAALWSTNDFRFHLDAKASGMGVKPSGYQASFYYPGDVDKLRASAPVTRWAIAEDDVDPPPREPDPEGEARRQEIIAASDAWWADRKAVEDAVGYTAMNKAWENEVQALNAAEDAVKMCPARTVTGLARKAAWVADLLAREASDDDLAELFARQVAAIDARASMHDLLTPGVIGALTTLGLTSTASAEDKRDAEARAA